MATILCLGLGVGRTTFAADSGKDVGLGELRGSVGTILVSGLVGGVLGLSTLSFYGEPEKHVNNVIIGAASGMILSAIYITVHMAQTPIDGKTGSLDVIPFTTGEQSGLLAQLKF